MHVSTLAPPALNPVSLADAKAFLQLDSAFEDALVTDMVKTATQMVEQATGKALIQRTLQQVFCAWPERGIFVLAMRPLLSLVQMQLRDAAGALSQVNPAAYYVDVGNGRLIALSGLAHGSFNAPSEAVLIDFVAGFGASESAVPPALRTALLLIVRDLYEHRGQGENAMSLRARALLAPFAPVRL